MKLIDILEEIPDYEIPKYDESSVIDSFMTEKPDIALKGIFGEAFWPKVERWLTERLKKVKEPKESTNLVGGKLRAKLDVYLEKGQPHYEENAETLAREILNSIKEWDQKVVKDYNLPKPKI